MRDAYGLIAFMVWEMERRYKIIEKAGVKQLSELNALFDENPEKAKAAGMTQKLPYHVVVIDEFAELKSVAPEVEDLIKRLAAKARACGEILILATQRPSIDVISGTLKSNFPSKIALRVNSSVNSQVILDHDGAEKLRGYGDSLILDPAGNEARVQGLYISNEEIDKIFSYLRNKYAEDMKRYKTYIDPAYRNQATDAIKNLDMPLDFKMVVCDSNLCKLMDMKSPLCMWSNEEGENPDTAPNNPQKWHVVPYNERRAGMGASRRP